MEFEIEDGTTNTQMRNNNIAKSIFYIESAGNQTRDLRY